MAGWLGLRTQPRFAAVRHTQSDWYVRFHTTLRLDIRSNVSVVRLRVILAKMTVPSCSQGGV